MPRPRYKYHAGEAHLEIEEGGITYHYFGTQILPLLEVYPDLKDFIKGEIEMAKKKKKPQKSRKEAKK